MARAMWVLVMTVLCSCSTTTMSTKASTAPGVKDVMEIDEIKEALARYEQALNASDVDAVLALYGREPVFMPQHAPAMIGRDAVRRAYEQVFATIRLDVRFEVHEVEVRGDRAWARTSSAGRTTLLASGEHSDEGNNELFVLIEEDGHWRIHRYLFATNQPPR